MRLRRLPGIEFRAAVTLRKASRHFDVGAPIVRTNKAHARCPNYSFLVPDGTICAISVGGASWRINVKCFRHPQSDAVGTCKYCFKGACNECAKDSDVGIVCSPQCEGEVRSLKEMVDRNKQAFPLVAKTHARNAILLTLFAVGFLAFSAIERSDSFLFPFFLSFGAILGIGAIFSFLMGRKFSKASRSQA